MKRYIKSSYEDSLCFDIDQNLEVTIRNWAFDSGFTDVDFDNAEFNVNVFIDDDGIIEAEVYATLDEDQFNKLKQVLTDVISEYDSNAEFGRIRKDLMKASVDAN